MAKKDVRQLVGLDCKDCSNRNYVTERNTINTKDKLEMQKYCKKCRKRTLHTEAKKLH